MSTLGAQARAAELAAAVIAKKRMEAIQEMEEQAAAQRIASKSMDAMIPPKNPTVSLEAFMKPAPINRNKGPKAWKALEVGSFEDRSDEDAEADKTESGTTDSLPKTSTTAPDSNHNLDKKPNPAIIPSGPRVMRLNITSRTTPQPRIQLPTVAPTLVPPASICHDVLPRQSVLHETTTPNTSQSVQDGSKYYPCRPSHIITPTLKPSDYYMVPDDLSPTKQESKFKFRKFQKDLEPPLPNLLLLDACYQNEQRTDPSQYFASFGGPSASFIESPRRYQQSHPPQLDEGLLGWDGENACPVNAPFHGLQAFGNDSYVNPIRPTQLPNMATDHARPNPQTRHQPYDTKAAMQKFLADQAERSKTDKGKTVLCNPDLYNSAKRASDSIKDLQLAYNNSGHGKNKSLSLPVPQKQNVSPVEVLDPFDTPKRNFSEPVLHNRAQLINTSLSRASFNQFPPELPYPSSHNPQTVDNKTTTFFDNTRQASSNNPTSNFTDRPLGEGKDFPASSFELGPITPSERKRTQACMAKAAKAIGADPNIPKKDESNKENEDPLLNSTSNSPSARHRALTSVFSTDARGQPSLRAQARNISVKHALDRRSRLVSMLLKDVDMKAAAEREQHLGFTLGVDDGLVTGLALGDVACNLQGYLAEDEDDGDTDGELEGGEDSDRKKKGKRDSTFFNHVRGVPEWCTERVHPNVQVKAQGQGSAQGLLEREYGVGGEGHSYFGKSWGTPPVRVARDPRFTRSDMSGVGARMSSPSGVGVGASSGLGNMASGNATSSSGGAGVDQHRVRGLAVNGMGREMEQLSLQLERRRLLEAQMGRRERGTPIVERDEGEARSRDREGLRTVM
ncbi:MAG: hypothetical protein Q9160_005744 [Pyrenula sp. 1 TL-2023]